jgi:hypothetical protein
LLVAKDPPYWWALPLLAKVSKQKA